MWQFPSRRTFRGKLIVLYEKDFFFAWWYMVILAERQLWVVRHGRKNNLRKVLLFLYFLKSSYIIKTLQDNRAKSKWNVVWVKDLFQIFSDIFRYFSDIFFLHTFFLVKILKTARNVIPCGKGTFWLENSFEKE